MTLFRYETLCLFVLGITSAGCATQKESYTARTGTEQLLISSAIDQSLDKVDLHSLNRHKVFLETKYLDCVDKNYVIVSLHHRLLIAGAKLTDKADEAEYVVEVGSGGVGTDAQELFVGVPEIPLPPPSPIAIPKLSFFTRNRLNGTAKLLVVVYDAKTKAPLVNTGPSLARSSQNTWHMLGTGTVQTGNVPDEIAAATKEHDVLSIQGASQMVMRPFSAPSSNATLPSGVQAIDFKRAPQ
jgi:hypothetical protein